MTVCNSRLLNYLFQAKLFVGELFLKYFFPDMRLYLDFQTKKKNEIINTESGLANFVG